MPTRKWMVNTQAFVDHVFFLSPCGGLAECPCNKWMAMEMKRRRKRRILLLNLCSGSYDHFIKNFI
jgi:hypothetical protein